MAAYAAAAACRRALNLRVGSVGTRFYCSTGSTRKCEGNVLDSAHKEAQRFADTKDELEEYRRLLKAAEKELNIKVMMAQVSAILFPMSYVYCLAILPPIK